MSKFLTIELPDEVYEYFGTMAAKAGQTVEEWARERLEYEAAMAELMKFAGAVSVPDPTNADNEAIDRDLAREYASTHEDGS